MAALSDLPSDDPYVWNEFQAIKDTVIENQKAGGLRDLVISNHKLSKISLTSYLVLHGS